MAFSIKPDFGHWLAGFTDGEGCFHIYSLKNGYVCLFQIALREDDMPILEEIRDTLGLGWTGFSNAASRQYRAAFFRISKKAECLELVNIFDEYPLRAKKRKDFETWKQAVVECNSFQRGSLLRGERYDWSKMAELNIALREGRKRMVEVV